MLSKLIRVGPDSTCDSLVVNMIVEGGVNAVTARLGAAEADALIATLGSARAALKEPVDCDLNPTMRPEGAVVDPAWRTSAGNMVPSSDVDGLSLAFRHAGYGWLCFVLPHEEAKALGHWLLDNAAREDAMLAEAAE